MTGPRDGYDSALTAIRNGAENLAVALATWQARDDTKPDAHARRAANSAIDAVDAMLRELHAIRQLLISEVQQADRATAARVDALLADRDQASRGHPAPGDTKAGALGTPRTGSGHTHRLGARHSVPICARPAARASVPEQFRAAGAGRTLICAPARRSLARSARACQGTLVAGGHGTALLIASLPGSPIAGMGSPVWSIAASTSRSPSLVGSRHWVNASRPLAAVTGGGQDTVSCGSTSVTAGIISGLRRLAVRRCSGHGSTALAVTSAAVPAVAGTAMQGTAGRVIARSGSGPSDR
jgi:hypothetical protein